MKNKILKQIYNERRANAWLVVELILVSAVLWWVYDYAALVWNIRSIPMGLDTTDVLRISLSAYNSESPLRKQTDFPPQTDPDGNPLSPDMIEKQRIYDRLKEDPEVVALTRGASNLSELYNYNFQGHSMQADSALHLELIYRINDFQVTENFFEVFIPVNADAAKIRELSKALEDRALVVTDNLVASGNLTAENLRERNEELTYYMDGEVKVRIGGVISPVKRAEYEAPFHATVFRLNRNYNPSVIYVRTAPGSMERVRDRIRKLDKVLRTTGNVHISDVKDYKQIRDDRHRGDDAQMMNLLVAMLFLFITVFLGTFGTFWFRTRERVKELAVHKVVGATNRSVCFRLIAEGLLLLTVATPVAALMDWAMVHFDISVASMSGLPVESSKVAAEILIVYVAMAIVVTSAILFPALKAMKIDPAETLRSE